MATYPFRPTPFSDRENLPVEVRRDLSHNVGRVTGLAKKLMGWFGQGKHRRVAESAELAGNLEQAVAAWMQAKQPEEAARVLLLRAEAEGDPARRLAFVVKAKELSPKDSPMALHAAELHATLVLGRAAVAAATEGARGELARAGDDLERMGDHARAAKAFKEAGDATGATRNLVLSGQIDELEHELAEDAWAERQKRAVDSCLRDVDVRTLAGDRRGAARLLREALETLPTEESLLLARARIEARRPRRGDVRVALAADTFVALLDREIILGRADSTLVVASPFVSKRHLRFFRENDTIMVEDLGTKGGTFLHGSRITGALPMRVETRLLLGNTVPIEVQPSLRFPQALDIVAGGTRYVAALGPLAFRTPGHDWHLALADDGWVELRVLTGAAYQGVLLLDTPITPLRGDAFSTSRGADPWLRLED